MFWMVVVLRQVTKTCHKKSYANKKDKVQLLCRIIGAFLYHCLDDMSLDMIKPAFGICEIKYAAQLRGAW